MFAGVIVGFAVFAGWFDLLFDWWLRMRFGILVCGLLQYVLSGLGC